MSRDGNLARPVPNGASIWGGRVGMGRGLINGAIEHGEESQVHQRPPSSRADSRNFTEDSRQTPWTRQVRFQAMEHSHFRSQFRKIHLDHSLAPTHTFILIQDYYYASSLHLEALLLEDNDGVDEVSRLSIPYKKKRLPMFFFLGSSRGLVLLHREPQFFILWKPLIGSSKRISYPRMVNAARKDRYSFCGVNMFFSILNDALLYGFGYDASRDDYIVVVAYKGKDGENHFDMCDLGSKSWINLDAALPKPMKWFDWTFEGLFCNGAIHWIIYLIRRKGLSQRYLCRNN
ncbi:hypothetical protein PIB30_001451 [Stylosanthes scabra]|uniref:Uncharacterized protein n=1 Tax=Stylosanthes scabra TaxID=79078 RepID=A0ABU6Q2G2_9FABA|nr:hypothetical protein [Stylosanthes scabra]